MLHVKKKWRRKGSHSSSVSSLNRLVWLQTWKKAMGWCTAQWKMLLFCVKTIVKESRIFWTSPSEEEEEEEEEEGRKTFGCMATFLFGTFAMLFSATGCVVHHESTWRWTAGSYNGL